jgi:uncharacterized membrane protein YcaP (DUF421 family)
LAGSFDLAQNGGDVMVYVILAIVFIVLLFAYMRVRGRRGVSR